MKHTIGLFALLSLLLLPALVLGQGTGEPPSSASLEDDIGALIDAFRSGSMIAIAAAAIMLLVDLFKAPWLGSLVLRVPKRWRIAIPILLSGVAGLLYDILGGVPWQEAVLVGLFAGPTAVFAHEAVVEAILGRARSRTPT